MSLSLVAAIAQNNCIGKDNKLPWHIPEDLQRFKALTTGKKVLMGRKTFESILSYLGKPLPNRTSLIVTRQNLTVPEGVEVYHSIDAALAQYPEEEIMVIGGAELYRETLPLAKKLYLTLVHNTVAGDTFFPEIDWKNWQETEREDYEAFSFVTYQHL